MPAGKEALGKGLYRAAASDVVAALIRGVDISTRRRPADSRKTRGQHLPSIKRSLDDVSVWLSMLAHCLR